MRNVSKSFSLLLILILAVSSVIIAKPAFAQTSNTSTSAPAIQWQMECGDGHTEFVSNLIQTSDGGYAFLDLGWSHQFFQTSTFYKVNSSGDVQWTKTINQFTASSLIQTNDGGYDISGYWDYSATYGGADFSTILKTDSEGNIQWYENTSVPYSSIVPYPNVTNISIKIQTSDGGFATLQSNSIIKTDSNGNQQWEMNLVFPPVGGIGFRYSYWASMIETQDGALAVIGVASLGQSDEGNIYLIKTEPFLPLPSPTQLPTPIPTGTPVSALSLTVAIDLILTVVIIVIILLLLYMRKRKTVNLSQ